MSENSNKKENGDNFPIKENIFKKEEEKIEENKQNEIDNTKEILFHKISLPFYKRKNNSINNNQNNQNKIILRNNRLDDNDLCYTHDNIKNYSKKNLSYIINDNYIYKQIQNENINLNNINKELLNNLELYEKENANFKKIIIQLNEKLKEKDEYLAENEKLILKLKNNYLNLSSQYEKIELQFQKNLKNKNEDDISQQNIKKKSEIEKYKKENKELIDNLNKIKIEYNKKIKELKEISFSYQELKQKSSNFIEMLKDREKIIEQNEGKINQLNNEIKNKDEQLELLSKYKKEEIKNNENFKNIIDSIIDKDNYKVNIFPFDEQFNIDILENSIFNINKLSFKLQEALKDILYIPSNANMSITKEYLINMNFKTELIKLECFSNYLREFNYVKFLKNLSNLINNCSLKDINNSIYVFKSIFEKMKCDIMKYINENNLLKNKIKDLYLYIVKIKEKLYGVNNHFKMKLNYLITLYEIKLNQMKEKAKNEINNKNIIIYNNKDYNNILNYNNYNYLIEHINSIYIKSTLINNKNLLNFRIKEITNKKDNNYILINNDSTIKENNYQYKKIENNKLKSEIERLKNEIAILIKDINEQQKELSQIKKYKNNNEEFKQYIQNKIQNFYTQLIQSKDKINNNNNVNNIIFNFIESLLEDFKGINNNKEEYNIKNNRHSNLSFEYEDLNKNIFTKSEYMKYLLIYEFTNINEIINVFYFMVNNSKQCIDKITLSKNDLFSDNLIQKKDFDKKVNKELANFKNEHILNESLIEIIKNFLIVSEKIKKYSNENNFKENSNKIFNIFNEGLLYKIEDLSEKDIFIRKLIIKILYLYYNYE